MFKKKIDLSILIILFLLVVFSNVILSKPIIGQGLTHEDYAEILKVRLLKDVMIQNPVKAYIEIGPHDATHDFYLLFLYEVFQNDFDSYLKFSVFLKIIVTFSLYFTIQILFKKRLLAFLTSLLFGISYASFGALSNYLYGIEYLSILFINLFIITYYYSLKKFNYWLMPMLCILISFTYLISPGRTFPIFIIILIAELFNRILNKPPKLFQLVRIFAVTTPFIIMILLTSQAISIDPYTLKTLPSFGRLIIQGNWYLLLNPIFGLGHMFLASNYFSFFGQINITNVWSYFGSIMTVMFIFGGFSLFFSLMLSQKPIKFFYRLMIINLLFDFLGFILLSHHFHIFPNLIYEYNQIVLSLGAYAQLIAFFILSLSTTCLVEWYLSGRKNIFLFLIFVSPLISLTFIYGQWLFTQSSFMYQEGVNRYLVIPQMTISLFLASIMTSSYEDRKKVFKPYLGAILIIVVFFIFNMSSGEIVRVFNTKRVAGADLQEQKYVQTQVLNSIPPERSKNNMLFFIKLSVGTNYSTPEEEAFNWRNFTYWMHLREKSLNGCVAIIWDYPELVSIIKNQEGIRGFLYKVGGNKEALCFDKGVSIPTDGKFFSLDDFYAFTFKDKELVNITEITKKNLTDTTP